MWLVHHVTKPRSPYATLPRRPIPPILERVRRHITRRNIHHGHRAFPRSDGNAACDLGFHAPLPHDWRRCPSSTRITASPRCFQPSCITARGRQAPLSLCSAHHILHATRRRRGEYRRIKLSQAALPTSAVPYSGFFRLILDRYQFASPGRNQV